MVKKYLATRGLGAVLKKARPSYPKAKPRGKGDYPTTKPKGMRGETTAEKYKKLLGPTPKQTKLKKKPIISKFEAGIGIGVTGTLGFQEILKKQKEVKAKEKEKKGKLKKANEKHKKKTKEKRKKYGKHHG